MIRVFLAAPIFLNSDVKMDNVIVIGIGNPFRGDDGVGWAVIDALEGKVDEKISLKKIRGDVAELLHYFGTYNHVFLIDACHGNTPVGSWHRVDALKEPVLLEKSPTSTHGLSLSEAVSMAKALNGLPSKLIIYGIDGDNFSLGEQLSLPVAKAVPHVVQSLLKELEV